LVQASADRADFGVSSSEHFLDQMWNGCKDKEVKFKKQAVKQNVKFHAGPELRADRPSRLHTRAAALRQQRTLDKS
jgi:hypothetical protein